MHLSSYFIRDNNQECMSGVEKKSSSSPSHGAVELLTAGNFAILSKAGVTTTGATSVTGDMGTSPIDATGMTGFDLNADSTNTFSTSALVAGNVYAADYAPPTPGMLTIAVRDMEAAYVDASTRPYPDYVEYSNTLGNGNIDGVTLEPGLYKWGTSIGFANSLTFNGSPTDVWILQIAEDVNVGSGASVSLSGGAQAKNIFWQVAGQTILGTSSHVEGVFLCMTLIAFKTGSSMNGAALSQNGAVTLDTATITKESVSDENVNTTDNWQCSMQNNFFAAIAGTGTVCNSNVNIGVAAVPSGCGCQLSDAAPCTYNPDLKDSEVSCFLCTSIDLASGVCPGCNSCLSVHNNCIDEATTEEQYSFCLSQIGDEDRANCHDMCLK
jgi:hypothetical protein